MSDHDPAAVARTLTEWQRFFAGFGVLGGYINRSEYASISALCQQAATALTAFAALCGPDGTPPVGRAAADEVVQICLDAQHPRTFAPRLDGGPGGEPCHCIQCNLVRRILKLLEAKP